MVAGRHGIGTSLESSPLPRISPASPVFALWSQSSRASNTAKKLVMIFCRFSGLAVTEGTPEFRCSLSAWGDGGVWYLWPC